MLLVSEIHCQLHDEDALADHRHICCHPQVHHQQPQLVFKHLLPAAMTLAVEARAEVKQATAHLLGVLADLMGSQTLLAHAAAVGGATQGKVRSLLAAGWG